MRPTKPRPRTRRPHPATAVLVACLLGAFVADSAQAGDGAPVGPGPAPAGVSGARAAAPAATRDATHGRSVFERLGDRLRGLPLRPVRIGRPARLPDDPEPGMGVVVRIPF